MKVKLWSGRLGLGVDWKVVFKVLEEYATSVVCPEDGGRIFLRNILQRPIRQHNSIP
jgi:hypothetical protein